MYLHVNNNTIDIVRWSTNNVLLSCCCLNLIEAGVVDENYSKKKMKVAGNLTRNKIIKFHGFKVIFSFKTIFFLKL